MEEWKHSSTQSYLHKWTDMNGRIQAPAPSLNKGWVGPRSLYRHFRESTVYD